MSKIEIEVEIIKTWLACTPFERDNWDWTAEERESSSFSSLLPLHFLRFAWGHGIWCWFIHNSSASIREHSHRLSGQHFRVSGGLLIVEAVILGEWLLYCVTHVSSFGRFAKYLVSTFLHTAVDFASGPFTSQCVWTQTPFHLCFLSYVTVHVVFFLVS